MSGLGDQCTGGEQGDVRKESQVLGLGRQFSEPGYMGRGGGGAALWRTTILGEAGFEVLARHLGGQEQ